jgi:hypothetical protein
MSSTIIDSDEMMSASNWHDTYLFKNPEIGDQESSHFFKMSADLRFAFNRWEVLELRRTYVINELYKMEELVIVAERKFREIYEIRKNNLEKDDSDYQSVKNDYETILLLQKKIKANFELVSSRLESAEIEYKNAKQEFDKAEAICNRIHNHSLR